MFSSVNDVRNALTPGGDTNYDDVSTAAGLPTDQLVDAIEEADSTIRTYIGGSYQIPQSPDDASVAVQPVRFWSRNIAAWLANLTYMGSKDVSPDDPVRLRYNETMAILISIRDGKSRPPLEPVPVSSSGGGGSAVFNLYEGNLFGPEDVLRGNSRTVSYNSDFWPSR